MELELLTEIITNVGFPIAVCIFLLYERNKNMQKFIEMIRENTDAVKDLKMMIEMKM